MKLLFLKSPKLTNYYLVYTRERDRESLKNGPKNIHYPDIVPSIFSSNHNVHKSSSGLCFWAPDPLIDRF